MKATKQLLHFFLGLTAFLLIVATPVFGVKPAQLKLQKLKFGKNTVYCIKVDPKNTTALAAPAFCPGYSEIDGNYPVTTLSRMTAIYRPDAIINGTFFDAKTKRTVCNVVVNGKLICEGDRGSTIYTDNEGKTGIMLTSRLMGRNINWSGYRWAIQSGPTLLFNGRIILNPAQEGFTDKSLFRATRRTGLGITKDGKILFIVADGNLQLGQFAKIMQKLGAHHGINLDGGSSTGLGFKGKYPVKPKRQLTGFIMLYENPKRGVRPDYPGIRLLLKGRDLMKARLLRGKAEALSREGKTPAALNYYMKACRILPWESSLTLAAAKALEENGRLELASRYYGKAASSALDGGASAEAESWAKRALVIDGSNRQASEVIKTLNDRPGYTETIKKLSENDISGAYHQCLELIKQDGNNPRFYFLLARVFSAMERDELKARAFYLSSIYFKRMKDREYESYLAAKHAVEAAPSDHRYRILLSSAALSIGDKKAATYHKFLASHLKKTGSRSKTVSIERLFSEID